MNKKIGFFYTTWADSGEKLLKAAKTAGVNLVPIHYSQVVCRGDKGKWEILFKNHSLSELDLFYFRNVGDKNEALPVLLEYATENNIPVVDQYLRKLGGAFRKKKSCEAMMLLKSKISYPRSIFISNPEELKEIANSQKKPIILKSTSGRHGTSTFLLKSNSQLTKVLMGRNTINFLIQEYIPNDGDYRLFLVGHKVVACFKRQQKEKKLILNRSQGKSQFLKKIPALVAKEADKATEILGVEIAGVDMVIDKRNQKPVVIEVNQAPEFYVMEQRTRINIAEKIINYLKERDC